MPRDTSTQPAELAQELDTEFRATSARLDRDEPWFGHFRLRVGGTPRAYKIGPTRVPDERIVDWRHPLARAYYEVEPGEDFELDQRGFAKLAGSVEALATLTTSARAVRRVQLRTAAGSFDLLAGEQGFHAPEAEPHGPTQADGLPDVRALLSPSQYRLITSSRNQPVVIQGRAGSGKTTVALYRVAWLTFASEDAAEPPVDPANVLIVMFNKALSSFVRRALGPLKLEAARLDTFHAWALDEIKRSYRGAIEMGAAHARSKSWRCEVEWFRSVTRCWLRWCEPALAG